MNEFMRLMVFFDLPVTKKKERQQATRFRNLLLKNGFYMMQFSVYIRICNGPDAVAKHLERVKNFLPANGSIRALSITEKQFERIHILLGNYDPIKEPQYEQLTFIL